MKDGDSIPKWLSWAREIQALTQTSDHFAENEFQRERYSRLREIAAEITSEQTGLSSKEMNQSFQLQKGYATPKVDVRGAVFRDDNILLVRERIDGGWALPGGWADVGDQPAAAIEREVWEEAGFQVKTKRVIGVYDANRFGELEFFHAFKLVFLCDLIEGKARPSNETSEVGFFGRDEIPQPFSGARTTAQHIEDAFTAMKDADNWITLFD